jgi:hypothetical protein
MFNKTYQYIENNLIFVPLFDEGGNQVTKLELITHHGYYALQKEDTLAIAENFINTNQFKN